MAGREEPGAVEGSTVEEGNARKDDVEPPEPDEVSVQGDKVKQRFAWSVHNLREAR